MDIIGLIESLESRINNYWNFYTVVVFANAGWVFNSFGKLSMSTAILLSIGLFLFFVSNLSFQRAALNILSTARRELAEMKDTHQYKQLVGTYSSEPILYRHMGTYVLHISVDAILITFIFMAVK